MILVKEGDKYRDKGNKKIYVVKSVYRTEVVLVGENGLGKRLTYVKCLENSCEKLEDNLSDPILIQPPHNCF